MVPITSFSTGQLLKPNCHTNRAAAAVAPPIQNVRLWKGLLVLLLMSMLQLKDFDRLGVLETMSRGDGPNTRDRKESWDRCERRVDCVASTAAITHANKPSGGCRCGTPSSSLNSCFSASNSARAAASAVSRRFKAWA